MQNVLVPLYLTDIYEHSTEAHRLHVRMCTPTCDIAIYRSLTSSHIQYMFTALRDCVPAIKWSRHLETPAVLLEQFDKEVSHLHTLM